MDKDEAIKRLDQQIAMMKNDFMLWMKGVISSKEYSFRMSDHLAAFSEILKSEED